MEDPVSTPPPIDPITPITPTHIKEKIKPFFPLVFIIAIAATSLLAGFISRPIPKPSPTPTLTPPQREAEIIDSLTPIPYKSPEPTITRTQTTVDLSSISWLPEPIKRS